jgi:hypothetical protein
MKGYWTTKTVWWHQDAIRLREQGYSYKQIQDKLNCASISRIGEVCREAAYQEVRRNERLAQIMNRNK